MEFIKFASDVFREFGAGNTALILILGMFVYFFLKLMPPAVERVVAAIEGLSKTFAVHDERAVLLYQVVVGVQADVQGLKTGAITPESISRVHDRIDKAIIMLVTKDDLKAVMESIREDFKSLRQALEDHADECERRNERLSDRVAR